MAKYETGTLIKKYWDTIHSGNTLDSEQEQELNRLIDVWQKESNGLKSNIENCCTNRQKLKKVALPWGGYSRQTLLYNPSNQKARKEVLDEVLNQANAIVYSNENGYEGNGVMDEGGYCVDWGDEGEMISEY